MKRERETTEAMRTMDILQWQNLLASIVQGSEDAIYSRSLDGKVTSWNPSAERIFGYKAAEILGRSSTLLLPPERARETRQILARISNGSRVRHLETVRLRKDGKRLIVSLSVSPVRDTRGRIIGASTIARDITAERELQAQLLDAGERERQRVGRELHDGLGQQLSGIELLSRSLVRALSQRGVPEANTARLIVKHMQDAIQLSRALARGLTPVLESANGLMLALEDLATTTRRLFRVDCRFLCEEPVLAGNHKAAMHLFRVAQEAVTNAIRHGKARRITISLRRKLRNVALEIEDRGQGFRTVPNPSTPGLGLRLMRYRAARLGGLLQVTKNAQTGAIITCTVPAAALGLESLSPV